MAKKQGSIELTKNQVSSLSDVIKGTNSFSLHIFDYISKSNHDRNFVVSPVCVQIVMAMVLSGASGKTVDEISNKLNIPKDVTKLLEGCSALQLVLKDPSTKFGTKIFLDNSLKVNDNFMKTLSKHFGTMPEKTDLKRNAKNMVNSWAEKETNVKDLISEKDIDPHITMLLVNAIYGCANWQENFSPGSTMSDDFYITEKNVVQLDMMFKSSIHNYTNHPSLNAKILQLTFDKESFSMYFILPNEINGLPKLEKALKNVDIGKEFSTLKSQLVDVLLPKFEISHIIRIHDVLQSLGAKDMFDTKIGGFSGIADGELAISKIIQKTIINVAELGIDKNNLTKTRPSFTINDDDDDDNERFKADHPFIFTVVRQLQKQIFIVLIGKFTGRK